MVVRTLDNRLWCDLPNCNGYTHYDFAHNLLFTINKDGTYEAWPYA